MIGAMPSRAVLMLHGAGGGGWEWNAWTRVFAAGGWTVRAPDLHAAPEGLAATTLAHYRAQAAAALADLPRPRVLVGASLGGLLALQCADAADALVLVNPLPPVPWHAQLARVPSRAPVEAWHARASLAGTRAALPDADAPTAWHAFRRWRDESGAVLAQARAGVVVDAPRCRTLVLVSGRDDEVPATASRALAQAFAADVIELANASHVGPLLGREAADIAARVVTWLNA
jgi:esterase/lipase